MQKNPYESRKNNTDKRHNLVRQKVNEYYAQTIDGIRLDLDSVLRKVADDFGYSELTVKRIMKH